MAERKVGVMFVSHRTLYRFSQDELADIGLFAAYSAVAIWNAQAYQELQRKTKELERSNKELNQFAYITSHDLKAPLRAIANLSQWVEEDLGDNRSEDISKHMDLLRGRVHRLEALIDESEIRYPRFSVI